MLSESLGTLVELKEKYVDLDKKFKEYYTKSDRYIKDKEQKLADVQAECQALAHRY